MSGPIEQSRIVPRPCLFDSQMNSIESSLDRQQHKFVEAHCYTLQCRRIDCEQFCSSISQQLIAGCFCLHQLRTKIAQSIHLPAVGCCIINLYNCSSQPCKSRHIRQHGSAVCLCKGIVVALFLLQYNETITERYCNSGHSVFLVACDELTCLDRGTLIFS